MSDDGLTLDDLLILATEESAEIIQAATKCQRFGWETNFPPYGINREVLAKEIGELLAIADALLSFGLDPTIINKARTTKIARALEAKKKHGIPRTIPDPGNV